MKKLTNWEPLIEDFKTNEQKEYEMKIAHIKRRLMEYHFELKAMGRFDFFYAIRKGWGKHIAYRRRAIRIMIANQLKYKIQEIMLEVDKIKIDRVED